MIHLAKHSNKETLLEAIAELNMTPDNLITIYASAYFTTCGLTRETWNEEAEQLIQQVSSFAADWQIKRMDLTPRGDIVVAVGETETANAIVEAQYITIQALQGAVYLPTGPVVEYGTVNHQKYSLRCNPPLDMDLCEIEHYLTKRGVKVKEIIIQTEFK